MDKKLHNKITAVAIKASDYVGESPVTLGQANEIAGALIRDLAIESQSCDCGGCETIIFDGEFQPDA